MRFSCVTDILHIGGLRASELIGGGRAVGAQIQLIRFHYKETTVVRVPPINDIADRRRLDAPNTEKNIAALSSTSYLTHIWVPIVGGGGGGPFLEWPAHS